jgi:hypothetical protein
MFRDTSYYVSEKKPFIGAFVSPKLMFHTFYLRFIKQDDPYKHNTLETLPEELLLSVIKYLVSF